MPNGLLSWSGTGKSRWTFLRAVEGCRSLQNWNRNFQRARPDRSRKFVRSGAPEIDDLTAWTVGAVLGDVRTPHLGGQRAAEIEEPDILVALLSSSYFASEFCWSTERYFMQSVKQDAGAQGWFGVIVRDVHFAESPFTHTLRFPKDAKAARVVKIGCKNGGRGRVGKCACRQQCRV